MNIMTQLSHSVGTSTMPAIVGAEIARPIAMIVRRMPRRLEIDGKSARDRDIAAGGAAGADHRPDRHGELAFVIQRVYGDGVGAAVHGDAVDISSARRDVLFEDILIRLDGGRDLIGALRLGIFGNGKRAHRLEIARGRGHFSRTDSQRVGVARGVDTHDIGVGGFERDLIDIDRGRHSEHADIARFDVHHDRIAVAHLQTDGAVVLVLVLQVDDAPDRQRDSRRQNDADRGDHDYSFGVSFAIITVLGTVSHHFHRFHTHDYTRFFNIYQVTVFCK